MKSTTLKTLEVMPMRGDITISTYRAGTHDKASPYIRIYNIAKKVGLKKTASVALRFAQSIYQENELRPSVSNRNLIMKAANVGMDVMIQNMIGIATYPLTLSWGEIGTGNTTPAITDTALTTPVARASLTAGVSQDIGYNQAQVQYFFPDNTLTNSTYKEFGCFMGGSASLGSGQIFNHSLFTTTYTKAAGTDITVQVNITLS